MHYPLYSPHKTAIMLPFDWIAAFGLCVFSVEDLEPLIHQATFFFFFFFPLFPPSGVYSFLRQKHQAVWNQAGAAAWCQEEVFPFLPVVSACFTSGVNSTVLQYKWGQQGPRAWLQAPMCHWGSLEDSNWSPFHHRETNNRVTKTWL